MSETIYEKKKRQKEAHEYKNKYERRWNKIVEFLKKPFMLIEIGNSQIHGSYRQFFDLDFLCFGEPWWTHGSKKFFVIIMNKFLKNMPCIYLSELDNFDRYQLLFDILLITTDKENVIGVWLKEAEFRMVNPDNKNARRVIIENMAKLKFE